MIIQNIFCIGLSLEPKQLSKAHNQNMNKKIINKNTKTIIHIGKNNNPNAILQHYIGFQLYF